MPCYKQSAEKYPNKKNLINSKTCLQKYSSTPANQLVMTIKCSQISEIEKELDRAKVFGAVPIKCHKRKTYCRLQRIHKKTVSRFKISFPKSCAINCVELNKLIHATKDKKIYRPVIFWVCYCLWRSFSKRRFQNHVMFCSLVPLF